ncbi:cytochrome C oxidase subunit IV family protein [Amycolatopsis sp. K13G38]|uniref:Cytochrome C oxidase subunit IV family protein n=1 Tax=Amycolatopsis acididurans TaxID=2724524 RepID=A0ABX1J768_9PSEU|nr:cytochrome C oxidase subunit IV family protein [Amycolatopsis acididurans]NKQ54190.1 cytochrome C oxidase subunit IV family protein [Amycolatopsis acididurans]
MPRLTALVPTRYSLAWAVLTAATIVSWYLGHDHGLGPGLATTLVLIVAFAKVRIVGLYFMELRDAPRILRGIFEGYCLIGCAVLLAFYHLP